MLDRLKAWNDRTRVRNQARADRVNAWMDTHGPNTFSPAAADARAVRAAMSDPDAVASLAGLTVYPDRIVRRDHTGVDEQPVAGVAANVDVSGGITSRATLTRAVTVGGGWQKEVDHRDAQLVIDGPAFQWVVPISPGQAGQARQFAATVTTIGRQASSG